VFSQVLGERTSGDRAVIGSDSFADDRAQRIATDEDDRPGATSADMGGFPVDGAAVVAHFRANRCASAGATDPAFPRTQAVSSIHGEPVVPRPQARADGDERRALEARGPALRGPVNILDLLAEEHMRYGGYGGIGD